MLLVAHQGVDLSYVEERRTDKPTARALVGLPTDRRLAVYTGKVHSRYGEIALLIEAARSFDPGTDLVVVGGREDQVKILRERVAAEGISNIHFVCFVAPADFFTYQIRRLRSRHVLPSRIPLKSTGRRPGSSSSTWCRGGRCDGRHPGASEGLAPIPHSSSSRTRHQARRRHRPCTRRRGASRNGLQPTPTTTCRRSPGAACGAR